MKVYQNKINRTIYMYTQWKRFGVPSWCVMIDYLWAILKRSGKGAWFLKLETMIVDIQLWTSLARKTITKCKLHVVHVWTESDNQLHEWFKGLDCGSDQPARLKHSSPGLTGTEYVCSWRNATAVKGWHSPTIAVWFGLAPGNPTLWCMVWVTTVHKYFGWSDPD